MNSEPASLARERGWFALAAATLMLLWCVGLFARGYWTPDEPREAALASSMVAQLQPLPVLAGHVFAEKPPLTYWLAGLAQRAFGMGPAAARLPQLGYAILAFLAVLALARRLLATGRPRRSTDPTTSSAKAAARGAAWVAATLFACGALVCQVQIWLDTDALLLAGVCLALEGMYAGLAVDAGSGAAGAGADAAARRARLRGYLRMHLGLALAFFAKNFAAWLVPALAFLCFIAWERRWRELWRWELHVGGLLLAGAILAWVSAVAAQPDGAHSLRALFWNNLLGRALPLADATGETYSSGHPNSPGKYWLELPLYLLPWCFIAADALRAAWRAVSTGGTDAAAGANADAARSAWRFAACAALPGLVVLSLAATARGIYAAPCMVGFALLAGLWAASGAGIGGAEPSAPRWPLRATAALIGLLAILVLASTVALQWTQERASGPLFALSAGACALAIGWALRARELLRLASAWCLLFSLGALALLGAVNRTQDIVALATRVAQSAAPGPMLLWNPDETTLAWAQLYLPAGTWSALDAGKDDSAARLAQRLRLAPATVVVSLLPGRGWSYAKWREYLHPHAVTASLSMIPLSQAAREPELSAAQLSVTTRVERPGGRGYLLWRSTALSRGATARELTPEVRARLFRASQTVLLRGATVEIPMQGTDRRGYYRCPYFQVFVNERGPFTFLYDTGAAYTVVSSRVVEAAGTPVVFDRNGHRDVVQVGAIRLGGVTIRDIWAIHDDTYDVDGVLGFPAFGSMNLQFDLAARRLTVSRDHIALPGGFELPYDAPLNVPIVPVVIGERAVPLLIDTGDDAFGLELKADELGAAAVEHPPVAALSVRNGSNIQPTRLTTLAGPVGLGPVRAERAVVAVNDDLPVGDLGDAVLRQFRFAIDPGRRVVTFQPLFAGGRFRISGNLSPGFEMSFDGSASVSSVVFDSDAARAGMEPGDELLEIDGQPARNYSPQTWDQRMEQKRDLQVRWRHAGAERSARVRVSELR